MLARLRSHDTATFFRVLYRASPRLAVGWWALLVLRGAMPALLAVATGVLVGAVRDGSSLAGRSTFVGRRLRRDAGAHAGAPGGQREPRRPHGRLAERPADGGVP